MRDEPSFELNGRMVSVGDIDPNTTLLHWLRTRGLTGTKEGCAEGECGACAVAMVDEVDGERVYRSVNSCLLPVYAAVGRQVVTVEGIASPQQGQIHPVQQAMVETGGSQCGYCTPGFVVSMFAEYYRPGRETFDLEAIGGNLCRCTGYRPIIDAAQKLPVLEAAGDDPHFQRLKQSSQAPRTFEASSGERTVYRPTTLSEALRFLATNPDAKVIAGGTDAVVEINQLHARHEHVLLLDQVQDLQGKRENDEVLSIGACEPLASVEDALAGRCEALDQLFPLFSSRLIRHRATLGGNFCNASPIGDGPPVFLALDASVTLSARSNDSLQARSLPLDTFFVDYRKTALASGELLSSVEVPKPFPDVSRFYKVSKRVLDDISTVAAAFALWFDGETIARARFAYGGVAATPVRARDAEAVLVGRAWNEAAWNDARQALVDVFSPMDDHRGSAKYRKEMIGRLFDKFFAQTHSREQAA